MSNTPKAIVTSNGVTVPPEMWNQIQTMLTLFNEPVPTATAIQLSIESVEPPLPLPSPAPQSPSGPIPNDHEDQDTKPISSNKETASDRGPSNENPTCGGSLQPDGTVLLITKSDNFDFSVGESNQYQYEEEDVQESESGLDSDIAAGINRLNTAVQAVLEQPCLSDQFLGLVAQDQPGPVGQICPTSWLSLRSDSLRPTTGRTRLFEHRSSSRVQPVNAGSASMVC
ncbi:hypothetical protein PCANC_23049 [Puccinia coronata f. sp. avenae]|uniref:Uncharacterized protein n=1 Tax=Puccinia coronata f. sp. avenae TaxID=200324 RepID=A0A2N5U628_9BASI|nr:hypothetical protein PCANC_23049 [Puccinia coronata f. sp. avenae]